MILRLRTLYFNHICKEEEAEEENTEKPQERGGQAGVSAGNRSKQEEEHRIGSCYQCVYLYLDGVSIFKRSHSHRTDHT